MNALVVIALICFAMPGIFIFLAYISKSAGKPWPNMWKRILLLSLFALIIGGVLIALAYLT